MQQTKNVNDPALGTSEDACSDELLSAIAGPSTACSLVCLQSHTHTPKLCAEPMPKKTFLMETMTSRQQTNA